MYNRVSKPMNDITGKLEQKFELVSKQAEALFVMLSFTGQPKNLKTFCACIECIDLI
jgi:hypothetical protein